VFRLSPIVLGLVDRGLALPADYVKRYATKEAADAAAGGSGSKAEDEDEDEVMSDVGSFSDEE